METHRRLQNLIVRGVVEGTDDTTGLQTHTVSLLAHESKANVERFQQYGVSTVPQPGSEVVCVFPNGNREHGIIVSVENRASRLPRMDPGEVSLYSDEGDAIALRRGNCVQIITHTLDASAGTMVVITSGGPITIQASGDVTVNAPNIKLNGNVDIANGYLKHNGVNVGSTHVHQAQGPNSITTPPR